MDKTLGLKALFEGFWFYKKLARLEGIEPPTYGLEVRCSILLSYRREDELRNYSKALCAMRQVSNEINFSAT